MHNGTPRPILEHTLADRLFLGLVWASREAHAKERDILVEAYDSHGRAGSGLAKRVQARLRAEIAVVDDTVRHLDQFYNTHTNNFARIFDLARVMTDRFSSAARLY